MNTTDHTTNPPIELIIANVLTQQASPDERQALQTWIEESETNRAYYAQCAEVFFATAVVASPPSFDPTEAYHSFCQRIHQPASPKRPNKTLRRVWSAAAACVVAACISIAFYGLGQRGVEDQFRPIVIETPAGAHLKLTLPDGSQLFLNANSRVCYSQGFGVSDRDIELQGEGCFEATHNPKIPLRVKTKELTVEVLGTKFRVTNYDNQPEAYVALIEGSVLLSDANQRELCRLQPDEQAVLNKLTGKTTIEKKSTQNEMQRTQGELVFENESLGRIATRLEQIYGVKIELDDPSLSQIGFHGSFIQSQTTVGYILDALVRTGKVTYTRNEEHIRISAAKKR